MDLTAVRSVSLRAKTKAVCGPRLQTTKFLRVMKLTTALILAASLHVAAAGHSQRVSLSVKDATLKTVFVELNRQTGYNFLYTEETLSKAKKVSINLKDATLDEVLKACFEGQPFNYEIVDKTIVIKEKAKQISVFQPVYNSLTSPPPPIDIRGRIVNEKNEPVIATVMVKGTSKGTTTNDNGEFELKRVDDNATLVITGVGIETFEVKVNGRNELALYARMRTIMDDEVKVMITGYQQIPKERATGSFDQVNNELLNRRVSTNILSRLEGIVSSLRFQTNLPLFSSESPISIRGKSTILSNTRPLIVVDNFPYDGDINNINPNDIENITILKDAAASSIWGAYSSNGVIVITTKKGRQNQPLNIEINSNVTVGQKPDIFYDPNFMSSSDFITMEQFVFNNGGFDADLTNTTNRPIVSPVVEILAKRRAGLITAVDSATQIGALTNKDVRKDFDKYFFRNSILQQHSISFQGGSPKVTYRFATGYDKNLNSLRNNDYDRFTVSAQNSFTPFKRAEFSVNCLYVQSNLNNYQGASSSDFSPVMNLNGGKSLFPYAEFRDGNGNASPIANTYRFSFIDTVGSGKLLDWKWRPLDELNLVNNKAKITDFKIVPSFKYNFTKGLSAEVRYQYEKQSTVIKDLHSQSSFFTRNLINLYTQINGSSVSRIIPLGDILDLSNSDLVSKRLRGQLNWAYENHDHAIIVLGGIETGEIKINSNQRRFYGYNENNAAQNSALDYVTYFPMYEGLNPVYATVPFLSNLSIATDETVSYFSNASYSYKNRYTVSASGRIDQANIFGVEFNNKSVPLWSIGGSWKISDEKFYDFSAIPFLKIRSTYGCNGNVNRSVGARLAVNYSSFINIFGTSAGTIINPPNPNLQWEKTKILNIGLDFSSRKNILSGSIEYYVKNGENLIGNTAVPSSSGFTNFIANTASMKGHGIDLELKTVNLNGSIKWVTDFLVSHNTDKVTRYNFPISATTAVFNSGFTSTITPVVGKPIYSVFSYRWAGLDPSTGDPQGYLGKDVSKSYSTIINTTRFDSLVYNGPALPTYFGAIRNTIRYKSLSISANIIYKLGYYFRAGSINYNSLFTTYSGHKDFAKRWQKPGDEKNTNVPSMLYNTGLLPSRDLFYLYSETLVHKGDHVRLQDVQLTYDLPKKLFRQAFNKIQVYSYVNNIGILWKANKTNLDPDYVSYSSFTSLYPSPRTYTLGVRCNF
jgi:TonB-dependent starch-binding outer membrane protein SusC